MKFFSMNPPWLVPLVLLLAALLVGIVKVRSIWEEMHEDEVPASDHERLSELEEAHAAGELDKEELQRIRALLGRSEAPRVTPPQPSRSPAPDRTEPPPAGNDPSFSDDPPVRSDMS